MQTLTSRREIFETAQLLAKHLEAEYKDSQGSEWTNHIFAELRNFSRRELGLEDTDCFHKNHPDGKGEFLWDFIAVSPRGRTLLVTESEQTTHSTGAERGLKHDFSKLLYVYAPIRVLICKAKDALHAESLVDELKAYAHDCCISFNPGSVFLLHFCLWHDQRSRNYIWQSEGHPSEVREETLKFVPL